MKLRFLSLLYCIIWILYFGSVCIANDANEKIISLPVGEISDVISGWWKSRGYQLQQIESTSESLRLSSTKGSDRWDVGLSPHSPLATRVSVRFIGSSPESRLQEFWDEISRYMSYSKKEEPRPTVTNIPTIILSKMESVVCVNAITNENNVQFSGFIFDNNGLILCTAHDLGSSQKISVTLYDGREVKAKLLVKDVEKDISILQIPLKTNVVIRLSEGRNLLGMGETIFTIGCPENLRGTVFPGTINSPPRKMNDQPLWQAYMEILHGSSGSPVFDADGNIVAMVKGRYRGTTTTAFLIPMETIRRFFKEKSMLL